VCLKLPRDRTISSAIELYSQTNTQSYLNIRLLVSGIWEECFGLPGQSGEGSGKMGDKINIKIFYAQNFKLYNQIK
jgi:hypothetical protein